MRLEICVAWRLRNHPLTFVPAFLSRCLNIFRHHHMVLNLWHWKYQGRHVHHVSPIFTRSSPAVYKITFFALVLNHATVFASQFNLKTRDRYPSGTYWLSETRDTDSPQIWMSIRNSHHFIDPCTISTGKKWATWSTHYHYLTHLSPYFLPCSHSQHH